MSGVPYTFGNATTSIPLSQLDVNFATNATLGNASVGLGNTTTTVGNLTVSNISIVSTNGDANVHGLTVGLGSGSVSTNTVFGTSALQANTSGANNTAIGYQAGYTNSTGTGNVFLGQNAGYTSNASSSNGYNTCVGFAAGYALTTGIQNTFIGTPGVSNGAGGVITTGSKNTIIGGYNGNYGGLDIRTSSNYIVLSDGDGNIGAYWNNGGGWYQKNNSTLWSITSDERIKKNITTNTDGLDKISQIQIRNFEYRLPTEIDSTLNKDLAVDITGTQLGVIAQELQAILPDCVTTQDSGILSVNASNVFWHLVTAVQQLNAQVMALQAKVGA